MEPAWVACWGLGEHRDEFDVHQLALDFRRGGGMIPARLAMAKTRSIRGLRTSLSMRSSAGPSMTRDSDLRRSHSTAVTLDRVSY